MLDEIWRSLARDESAFRILFVGVRPYTRALTRSLRRASIVTIDRDPRLRIFGASTHHTIAIADLAAVHEAPFDLAVVNGVLGWGVDAVEDAEHALDAICEALRPHGMLVLGINEKRSRTPDVSQVRALQRFRPVAPPPLGVQRCVVPTPLEGTHTFLFFERP